MSKYEDLRSGDDSLLATTGRAWTFGDHVCSADILAAAHLGQPAAEAVRFLFADVAPGVAANVSPGDFVVAGLAFADDATHPIIPAALAALGIGAVIARSVGAVFLRSATALGLPVLVVEETGAIKTGDCLRVDVEAHIVANLSSGDRYVVRNVDEEMLAVLRKKRT